MEKDNKIKKNRLLLIVLPLLFLALILTATLYLLSVPIDLSGYHAKIESMIESRTGMKATLEKIVVKALPVPDITLEGVKLYEDKGELFKAKEVRLRFPIPPLFEKKLVIEDIEAREADLFVRRDRNRAINIEEFFRGKKGGQGGWQFIIQSLNVKDSRIRISDDVPSGPVVHNVTVSGGYLYGTPEGFTYGIKGRLLPASNISFSGHIDQKKAWAISGSGTVGNFDLAVFNPYIQKGSPDTSVKGALDAQVSYDFDDTGYVKGFVSYKDLEGSYPAALNSPMVSPSGSASIGVQWDGKGAEVELKDLRVELPEFNLAASFKLSRPEEPRPFALDISSTPIPFKAFKALIPTRIINPAVAARINSLTPLGGKVTVKNISLKGPFEELKSGALFTKPEHITFKAILDGVKFKYRGFKETFSDFSGTVSLQNRFLSITDITGRYSKETIKNLKAELGDLTGRLDYDISLDGQFDAKETIDTAKVFLDRKTELSKRLEKATVAGEVGLRLNMKGAMQGKTPAVYSGESSVRDGRFLYAGLPGSFFLSGDVSFNNKKITLNVVNAAEAGGSTFTLKGYVEDYVKEAPYFGLETSGTLTNGTLTKFIPERIAEKLDFSGNVMFRASANGTRNSFDAAAVLDASGTDLTYGKFIEKASGFPLSLEAYAGLNGKELSVKRAGVKFGGSLVEAGGSLFVDRPVYNFLISSKQLRLADIDNISPFLIKDYESEGLVSFRVGAAKKSPEAEPLYEGVVLVKDARFNTTLIAKPVDHINAAAFFDGNSAHIKIDGLKAGRTELNARIEVVDIAGRVVKFDVTSPVLYLEDLYQKSEPAEKEAPLKKPVIAPKKPPFTGSGSISVAEGDAWGHPFKDFRTGITVEESEVILDPFSFRIDQGTVSGDLTYYRGDLPVLFNANLNLSGIHLDMMLSEFGVKKKVLTGTLKGQGSILGKRGEGSAVSSLSGVADLSSERGRLWKGVILTKIFSIVNIFSIDELFKEGLPYKTLSGNFSMKDGIISTDRLAFDSDSMRMSAVGELNVPESKIDSVLAMSPFVTIDKIITSIPFAGWIIGGREKSTVSMYFDIKGPLKDPDITPRPIEGIGKGIYGILKRLIETPAEVLKPESK